jgi:exopolysaccharide biosynthesis polyprenyl glycosylphosphotransferase
MLGYPLSGPFALRAATALLVDLACFGFAATLAWVAVRPPFSLQIYALATALGAACGSLALGWCDAYKPAVLGSPEATLRAVIMSMGLAFLAAVGTYFLVPLPRGALPPLVHTAAFYFPLVLIGRAGFLSVSRRSRRRLLVIGTSELGVAIARMLRELPNLGIELVGFLSNDELAGEAIGGFPILGRISRTEKAVRDQRVDWIVVASQDQAEHFPAEELLTAKLRGCRVESGLAFYERLAGRVFLPGLNWGYLIFADGLRPRLFSASLKRGADLVLASVGLVLAAPLLVLAALAIRVESPGPPFFWQPRVGRGDRVFRMLKLRSMRNGAEEETGAVCASEDDERITRVGRFLRRTHLDEVPQLWNVLIGEMSLIGPRPERPEFVEMLTNHFPLFRFRSAVRPGITGWAQVRYGYAGDREAFEQKLSLDLYYLKHRSFTLDLVILWETVKAVLLLRGT